MKKQERFNYALKELATLDDTCDNLNFKIRFNNITYLLTVNKNNKKVYRAYKIFDHCRYGLVRNNLSYLYNTSLEKLKIAILGDIVKNKLNNSWLLKVNVLYYIIVRSEKE